MLDAVGFDATVEVAPAPAASARQFTGDYEMAIGGLATTGADPASTLASSLTPGGAVKGVSPTISSTMLFDGAFLEEKPASGGLRRTMNVLRRRERFAHLEAHHGRQRGCCSGRY